MLIAFNNTETIGDLSQAVDMEWWGGSQGWGESGKRGNHHSEHRTVFHNREGEETDWAVSSLRFLEGVNYMMDIKCLG